MNTTAINILSKIRDMLINLHDSRFGSVFLPSKALTFIIDELDNMLENYAIASDPEIKVFLDALFIRGQDEIKQIRNPVKT